MSVAVSIVIPTYRREQVLCETLRALLALAPEGCEIIVVDQTPEHEPATRDYLASVADRIRYLRLDAPNLPRARNAGWRAASGEIVLYLDDDVIPRPGLVEAHRRAYVDATVGGVAGRVLTVGTPLPDSPNPKSRLPGVGWLFFNFAQVAPAEVATARGCNMSLRRAVLEELGGFDERYLPWPASREESDLCFRMRRNGYRVVFEPQATVEHLRHGAGGERTGGTDLSLSPRHHVNNLYFFWKNVPWRHRPLTLLVLLVQELRPGRVGVARRGWRSNVRIAWLFARGAWVGWRQARMAPP